MNRLFDFISESTGKIYAGWLRIYLRILTGVLSTTSGKWFFSYFRNTKVYKALIATDRVSSLDVYRALAIIGVVIYHYHHKLKFGNLGVDLFFVISGLLVGGILTREFEKNQRINIPKFLLQRGFKIWPSYYFLIAFGSLTAFIFYRNSHPEFQIPWWDLKKYLLFYQNYDEYPIHWVFDHVWSLCVEEHFYVMLPLVFFTIQLFCRKEYKNTMLYIAVFLAIVLGVAAKYFSVYYTASGDTYTGTHNRIDALAWGVLLNLVINRFGEKLKRMKWLPVLTIMGIGLFLAAVYIDQHTTSIIYKKIVLQSFIPICFFMAILGSYYLDFSKFYILRGIGYYSYNWYLWHPMFVWVITDMLGPGRIGLSLYIVISLAMAVMATIFIEEPFLELRKKVIPILFKKPGKVQPATQTLQMIK